MRVDFERTCRTSPCHEVRDLVIRVEFHGEAIPEQYLDLDLAVKPEEDVEDIGLPVDQSGFGDVGGIDSTVIRVILKHAPHVVYVRARNENRTEPVIDKAIADLDAGVLTGLPMR